MNTGIKKINLLIIYLSNMEASKHQYVLKFKKFARLPRLDAEERLIPVSHLPRPGRALGCLEIHPFQPSTNTPQHSEHSSPPFLTAHLKPTTVQKCDECASIYGQP